MKIGMQVSNFESNSEDDSIIKKILNNIKSDYYMKHKGNNLVCSHAYLSIAFLSHLSSKELMVIQMVLTSSALSSHSQHTLEAERELVAQGCPVSWSSALTIIPH